jgi:hypothetical protein
MDTQPQPYVAGCTYSVGDIVERGGHLYKSLHNTALRFFEPKDWQRVEPEPVAAKAGAYSTKDMAALGTKNGGSYSTRDIGAESRRENALNFQKLLDVATQLETRAEADSKALSWELRNLADRLRAVEDAPRVEIAPAPVVVEVLQPPAPAPEFEVVVTARDHMGRLEKATLRPTKR